ncbi:hypothetical protein N9W60_04375 [Flavobacteriaceae bacterium]|nr:hypothetical protein [Flavobacteriaceae bacterium]
MMLEVIHENKDLIVVNKQSGLISEKSPFEKITVEDQITPSLELYIDLIELQVEY